MSELATLARPYATAVFKRAKETGSTAEWSEFLSFLAVVVQDPQIEQAAANPKGDRHQFTSALLDLCGGAALGAEQQNLVRLLITNKRLDLIKHISEQFEQFRAEDEGYIAVDVGTAYAIDQEEHDQLTTVLRQTLGKEPRLHIRVDDSLIGGVFIRAGDRVIDASVRGQIQRLATRLYN